MAYKSLILIALDGIILFLGLGILFLQGRPEIDGLVFAWGAGAVAVGLILQFFLIRKKEKVDIWLLPMVLFLAFIGIIMLARLKPILCIPQLRWLLLGMLVMLIVLQLFKYFKDLMKYQYILGLVTLLILCLSLLFGTEIGGSKNWLILGPVQVQPSEFGKILLVLFLAAYLSDHKDILRESCRRFFLLYLPPIRFIAPLLCIWGMAILMFVVQRDLGSALLFFCLALFMTYMATGSKSYMGLAICFFVPGTIISYLLFSHVQVRFRIWLDPWQDPTGQAYQVVQSLFSFGSGGIWGTGLGLGHPELIPEVHTDFIFSAIGEELGLIGSIVILSIYTLFFYRNMLIALKARNELYALVVAGLGITFYLQAFIILAGVTKLLPLTGITLPFVSYGGSSMLSGFIMLGLILAISMKESRHE